MNLIRRSLRGLCLLLLSLALPAAVPQPLCAGAVAREYQVKGAFLYKFILFVSWPESAFATDKSPLTIGVLGKNLFGNTLEELNGQNAKNRKLVIRPVTSIDEARECQILFISISERGRLHQILSALHKTPVLTVSDIAGFTNAGGMINFVSMDDKVRFEVNLKEAQNAGLKISSQMLKLAREVVE